MKTNSDENKVALVTGGTSGVGKATAFAFANAGAKVVLTGRREKEGTEVVAEIKTGGGAIVNTSSAVGHVGVAEFSVYVASKHAGFTTESSLAVDGGFRAW
jgi:NAD(P)-dependent dehydrogenase (short-subunit alcohol dehydrogenase family)